MAGDAGHVPDSYGEKVRQRTGFARMPDAGRIAFAVAGSGPAIVMPAWWVSHLAEDWNFDPLRRFVEGLAAEQSCWFPFGGTIGKYVLSR